MGFPFEDSLCNLNLIRLGSISDKLSCHLERDLKYCLMGKLRAEQFHFARKLFAVFKNSLRNAFVWKRVTKQQ